MARSPHFADRSPGSAGRPASRRRPDRSGLGIFAVLSLATVATAQETPDRDELLRRLDAQEARIRELEQRAEVPAEAQEAPAPVSGYEFVYDKGYVFRSTDPDASPFMLKINGRMQLRYTGFAADVDSFENLETDASGNPIDVTDINDVEIERGRLEFRGTWLDEDLHFFINIDADTDDNHTAIFHDFWFNYEFSKAFDLYGGKGMVPGSRDWLQGSTRTRFADRSLATSYFRPDRSVGIWAKGEPIEDLHYHAMLANGIVAADLAPEDLDTRFSYAGSVWWDPIGEYGSGYSDLEHHEELAVRFGSSFTYSPTGGVDDDGRAVAEERFLRISDGSRLSNLGVDNVNLYLLAVDAAFKLQGFSVNTEWFYRWLQGISPTGPSPSMFPIDSTEDWGFYVDAGFMVIPHTLEPIARVSTVKGDFKDSWEYAVGMNWYITGTHENKLCVDVTWLDGAPVSSSGPNYRVGDDGVMIRAQWQIAF